MSISSLLVGPFFQPSLGLASTIRTGAIRLPRKAPCMIERYFEFAYDYAMNSCKSLIWEALPYSSVSMHPCANPSPTTPLSLNKAVQLEA